MLTKEEALSAQEFHYAPSCQITKTKRGKRLHTWENWRRNGQTQTWKTRPNEFRVPVKFGLYAYGQITHDNAHEWHTEKTCPHIVGFTDEGCGHFVSPGWEHCPFCCEKDDDCGARLRAILADEEAQLDEIAREENA